MFIRAVHNSTSVSVWAIREVQPELTDCLERPAASEATAWAAALPERCERHARAARRRRSDAARYERGGRGGCSSGGHCHERVRRYSSSPCGAREGGSRRVEPFALSVAPSGKVCVPRPLGCRQCARREPVGRRHRCRSVGFARSLEAVAAAAATATRRFCSRGGDGSGRVVGCMLRRAQRRPC